MALGLEGWMNIIFKISKRVSIFLSKLKRMGNKGRAFKIRHKHFRPSPSGLCPLSFVPLRVPLLDSETGLAGELWSKTNLLNRQNLLNSFFLAKKKYLWNFLIYWTKLDFSKFFQIFFQDLAGLESFGQILYS